MPSRPHAPPAAPRRAPGRPRSDAARAAILRAALHLSRTRPLAEVTVEAIAAEAGVGKQTIYRWWEGKAGVLLEALGDHAQGEIPEDDRGSLELDLRAFLAATLSAGARGIRPALRALMAEAQRDPALARAFREGFVERRRRAVRRLLSRAAARGELGPDADRELLVDLVYGAFWYRLLVGHAPLDARFARTLARTVAAAARG